MGATGVQIDPFLAQCDEYGPSQARGGEINTYPRMCEKGAACACSAVDIWGSAWATTTGRSSVGKGLTLNT